MIQRVKREANHHMSKNLMISSCKLQDKVRCKEKKTYGKVKLKRRREQLLINIYFIIDFRVFTLKLQLIYILIAALMENFYLDYKRRLNRIVNRLSSSCFARSKDANS